MRSDNYEKIKQCLASGQPIPDDLAEIARINGLMLPIELVPNTDPPRFTWQQVINGNAIGHSGPLWPTVEGAVKRLIELANKLTTENAVLRGKLAAQSEMLAARSANTVPVNPTADATAKPMNLATGNRKG